MKQLEKTNQSNQKIVNREERLAKENLFKLMLSMGIPTFIAQLINLLYNIVDRIYIGHIPGTGSEALTGIGLCFPILSFVAAFSSFVGAGGAPLAAIALGKGDRGRAEKILSNGVTMLCVFAIMLTSVFYVIKEPFLYMFGASPATFPYADEYLSIYLLGTIFVLLSVGLNTFITAQGQAKIAMCSVLIGAVMNLILDPIFIFGFGLETKGAAIATILSQACSAIWVVRFLSSKKASLRIQLSQLKPDFKIIGSIAALGISPFIMSATESLITVVFNQGCQKYGNDLYVGSITILQSVLQVIFVPVQGFSMGVQPIISYNYGAGNIQRVKKTCVSLICLTTGVAFVMSLFAICFPGILAGMFTPDKALIGLCEEVMPIFLSGMLIFGIQTGCQQSFMALGKAKQSLFFALWRKVILLVPLALILPRTMNSVMGIYYAEPISDAISAISCGIVFFITFRRIIKENANPS